MNLITTNTDLLNDLRTNLIEGLQKIINNCNEHILDSKGNIICKKANMQLGYSVNLSTFDDNNEEVYVSDITGEFHDLPDNAYADDFIGITDSMEFVFETSFNGIQFVTKEELSVDTIASLYDFVLSFPQSK